MCLLYGFRNTDFRWCDSIYFPTFPMWLPWAHLTLMECVPIRNTIIESTWSKSLTTSFLFLYKFQRGQFDASASKLDACGFFRGGTQLSRQSGFLTDLYHHLGSYRCNAVVWSVCRHCCKYLDHNLKTAWSKPERAQKLWRALEPPDVSGVSMVCEFWQLYGQISLDQVL